MNRKVFYDFVRNLPFGGRISTEQFEGLEQILVYQKERYPDMDVRWLAYILATVFHETARTMQPIKERGGTAYLKSKKYWPWYGRGLVQITWEENYKKWGIENPDDALKWPVALNVLFDGMINAKFTKYRLSQFFNSKSDDPKGARKIVNGTDKDSLIATYHQNFLDALKQAEKAVEAPSEVRAPSPKADKPDAPSLTTDPITQVVTGVGGLGVVSQLVAAVTNPWALAFGVAILIGVGVFFYLRSKQARATGV